MPALHYPLHLPMHPAIVLILAVAHLLIVAGCDEPAVETKPEIIVVGTQRAEPVGALALANSAPEYIATVRANEETDFSFKVAGVIEIIGPEARRDWEEGSLVRSGAVLARLRQGDFINALASAKANAELTRANNERIRKLLTGKVVSKQEADKARADSETADAQLKQAEQNLRDSELRAPRDGVVFVRYVNSGETIAPGKPILRFGDVQTMSVELGIPDRLVGRFSVGEEIDVNISALPGRPPFRGTISEVGVAASREGRLYRIVIKVPNPDGLIRSGMTATVRAGRLTQSDSGHVRIPLSALVAPPGTAADGKPETELAVFVVADGKASLRRVQTEEIIASSIIVSEGLRAGEVVVTKGTSQLYDGAPVAVR